MLVQLAESSQGRATRTAFKGHNLPSELFRCFSARQPSRTARAWQKSLSKPGRLIAANEAGACEAFALLGPFALAPEQKQMCPCW